MTEFSQEEIEVYKRAKAAKAKKEKFYRDYGVEYCTSIFFCIYLCDDLSSVHVQYLKC